MSNTFSQSQSTEDVADLTTPSEKGNNSSNHNEHKHHLRTMKASPFNGIRQYTNQLSPKLANPGYIARSRQIYDSICPYLSKNHPGWYVVIEPDSGDYFLNVDKDLAKNEARQKYPKRLFCAFKLITSGV